jgi:hypothetical protein
VSGVDWHDDLLVSWLMTMSRGGLDWYVGHRARRHEHQYDVVRLSSPLA